jgi:hypothetical protein
MDAPLEERLRDSELYFRSEMPAASLKLLHRAYG